MWDLILKILDYGSKIIILPTILWGGYLYIENRKLRSFEIDKEIALKENEIQKLNIEHSIKIGEEKEKHKKKIHENLMSGEIVFDPEYLVSIYSSYKNAKEKIEVELRHLEKIKKYKWIFSK